MMDIYFEKKYGKLYEKIEKGVSETFEFENEKGKVSHTFIKRLIPFKVQEEHFYDIVTPYGYGGPLVVHTVEEEKVNLIEDFTEAFESFCFKNNIISEFIRFHPLFDNWIDFYPSYNIMFSRNTVGTDLESFDNPVEAEFSKSCRKNIRKALDKGITYKITKSPNDIQKFKEIYYSTMERNNASEYYYFDDEYFDQCLKEFQANILLVEAIYQEKTIAMGFYFVYGGMIHIHLSGTLSEYLHLSPAYILRYAVTKWGKENGYSMIHHGGGRTNDEGDNLYKFKKQFGKNTEYKFYTGKKIWNNQVYDELCEITGNTSQSVFFPKYRNEKVPLLVSSN